MELIEQTKQIAELTDSEIENIFLLTQSYYVESKSIFSRELEHNNMIYLLKDRYGSVLSFFMVGWEKYKIQNEERETVYLGLSCTGLSHQEKKFSSRLYYNFINDAYNYQQKNNNKLILYCITATPIILLTLPKVLDNVKPDLEGNYNKNDKEIIETIKKSRGLDKFSAGHPYVLKGVAVNTKYSMCEEDRLKKFKLKNEIKIFERLGIDESNGDRLLITCDIPSKSKLDILKSKLVKFPIDDKRIG